MECKVIFTDGYDGDIESLTRGLRCDVLLIDKKNNYYNPQFITLNRMKVEFDDNKICYLEDNLVVLHLVTKDNILKSVQELYKWKFYRKWVPISHEQLEKYFHPQESWIILDIEI